MNTNDRQMKKKMKELVFQNEGLELNIASLKKEIGFKQIETGELKNEKAVL